jgi:hypothetical protein
MEWFDRLGGMYMFLNDTPALAHDMSTRGPQSDLAYNLAYSMQNTSTDLDAYPADTQTAGG